MVRSILLTMLFLAAAMLLLALWLLRQGHAKQQTSGLPIGEIIYSDTNAWQAVTRPLLSRRHGIVGKPDYVVAEGHGRSRMMVPVEVKSGKCPETPPTGHLLQLAAYCLLVEEHYGTALDHGLLRYADATLRIPFTSALRAEVLAVAEAIRRAESARSLACDHNVAARCRACGYRHGCGDEALV